MSFFHHKYKISPLNQLSRNGIFRIVIQSAR